ncbi:MAG: DUF4292 domain-containing protein [Bacteroidota bacterium]|jgi:hypothetical protein
MFAGLKNPFSYALLVALMSVWLFPLAACRTVKVTPVVRQTDSASNILTPEETEQRFDYKSAKKLMKRLDENAFDFRWMFGKINASVLINDKSNEFQVFVRARKDSALWLSFQLFGIEGARLLATNDSVKFIDRLNQRYFSGDYSFFSSNFHVDFDFSLLESLITGNPVEFFREDEKLRSFREQEEYVLSTVRRRKFKKMMQKLETGDSLTSMIQRMYISPSHFKITKNLINDYPSKREFKADYGDFRQIDSLLFPFVQRFELNTDRKIEITLNYQKLESGKAQSFPFAIPARYENMVK